MEKHKQEIKSQNLSNGFAKHLEVHHKDHVKDQNVFVKTQRNSTQLNATLKQLALELDIVVMCSPPHPTPPHPPHPPQTFQPLLDQLES